MERTGENGVPTLFIYGTKKRGRLYIPLSGQEVLSVDLPPAWAAMLLVLEVGWKKHEDLPPELRGWLLCEEIADMYRVYTGDHYSVQPHAISQYFSRMKALIFREAASRGIVLSDADLPWRHDKKLGRRITPEDLDITR